MFRIPTITKNLLIINFIAFLATVVLQMRGIDLAEIGVTCSACGCSVA